MARRYPTRRFRRLIGLIAAGVAAWALVWGSLHRALPMAYRGTIEAAAAKNGLQPDLVAAVIRVESGYRSDVESPHGAIGLMQVMPQTAAWIHSRAGIGGDPPDLYDPGQNIALGTWYLGYLCRRYRGTLVVALAAYNGGPTVADRWLEEGRIRLGGSRVNDIPYPETRHFVVRVLRFRRLYHLVYGIR